MHVAAFGARPPIQPASPLQSYFGARSHAGSDTVQFGATANYKGFRPEDVAWMRRDMAKSRYAKDIQELIDSPLFHTSWDREKNEVTLANIRLPAHADNYRGVCDDLPRHMLKRLQKQFDDRYVFEIVGANDDKYFFPGWEHYVLLAWPKNRDAEIRKALAEDPLKFPPGVLLIDPSLQNFGMPGKDLNNYTLNGETVDIQPDDVMRFYDETRKATGGTSLGHWKDLDPYHDPEDANAVIILAFRRPDKDGDPSDVIFKIQPEGEQQSYLWSKWEEDFHPDSPLRALAGRIRADLQATA